MKPIRNITTALSLAALALTGCNNEDMTDGNALPEGAVHITATIDGQQTRATIDASTGAGTFEQGDVWGLYTTIGGTSSENKEYTYQETRLLWGDLSTTAPVTFSAHYPRIAGTIANPTEYDFLCSNQDLLSATATASKGEEVNLTFRHLMHRLVVNLTKGEGVEGELTDAKITTNDLKSTVKVNLIAGTVNPETAIGSVKETGTGATLDCIVVPQDLTAGGDWIIIRMNNGQDVYTYKVPSSLKEDPNDPNPLRLESGKKLTLNLTLKKTGATTEVELTSSEISRWGDGDTIEDEVTIGGDTPAGTIDMAGKTVDEVKAAIQAALAAGNTELKLTGPIANSGIGGGSTGTFWENKQVTKIDLTEVTDWQAVDYWGDAAEGDAVIGLPAYAFYGCTSLTEIKLPAAVKAIGVAACNNTALTTINLGEVTHVGWSAFENCSQLTSVDLTKATTLYGRAFTRTGLTSVNLPVATAVSVGGIHSDNGSFSGCAQLASIQAPKLEQTGFGTFSGCKALTTVDMPALKSIGEMGFNNCKSLTEIGLSQVTTIGPKAFMGCTALEKLNLPAAMVFENYFVSGCSSLTEIKATADGAFQSSDGASLDNTSAFANLPGTAFDAGNCALTLNPDKQSGGSGSPTVNGNSWAKVTWQSISYAVSTAKEVETALTGTGTADIVIDGDLTLSLETQIAMGADHTLIINEGATLTIDNKGILCFSGGAMRTLTIKGGGTLLTRSLNNTIFQNGNLKLEDITVRMEGGKIYNANIAVGNGATILLDGGSQVSPIWLDTSTKTITVNTGGKIEVKSFVNTGILYLGTLLIDGGTVSISGLGTVDDGWQKEGRTAAALCMSGITGKLEICNGGTLVSTVADGTVFLTGKRQTGPITTDGCKVKGASGLFGVGDFTLGTDAETEVDVVDADGALRSGLYKWNGNMFVWAVEK